MKITKKQLRKLITEVRMVQGGGMPMESRADPEFAAIIKGQQNPAQFTSMCMESIDLLIGEANMMGMSFPDIIGEIQRCLDKLAEEGW